jgi:threonine/homoserine/homoserine lactone efflux protein
MLHSLFEGLALGLTLALFFGFGPAFFALLQTGIHRGFKKGFFLAFGIFLNDLSIVALSIWGAHAIMVNMQKYQLFGVLGGIILILFGIFSFQYKSKINGKENTVNDKGPRFYTFIIKGFLMNLANPFVWLFWPTIVLGVAAPFMTDTRDMVLFFSGTLSVVFLSDVTKVYLASRIKRFITAKFLQWVNRIAGIGLIVFGFVLIFRTLYVAGIL